MHLLVHLKFSANTYSTGVWQIVSNSNAKSGIKQKITLSTNGTLFAYTQAILFFINKGRT
ncbi:MAG TPA: hypothetical protein ENL00_01975 [Nitratifractor sp.]|nr:hypothetical protein [Nitratifractor sp.]